MWKRREHSDDPKVVFGGQGQDKVNARRANSNALDEVHAQGRDNFNGPDKGNAPGGWMERVAGDRA